ncbi:MAG: hypothetical protein DLM60_23730 [Pseudonocardiales bacterium]|nr:hypothetical protein [Actinomycetota bacterium]PZS11812.1 MAG: hypothetical protein DLM60_23730 [Pseudonocardiales bacterium]
MNSQHDAVPATGAGQNAGAGGGSGRDEFPGVPRWAKVLGIVLFAALVVAGIVQNTLIAGMAGH